MGAVQGERHRADYLMEADGLPAFPSDLSGAARAALRQWIRHGATSRPGAVVTGTWLALRAI